MLRRPPADAECSTVPTTRRTPAAASSAESTSDQAMAGPMGVLISGAPAS